jgi:hypothetical protein
MAQLDIGFPDPKEYDAFYTGYVQLITESNVLGVLQDQQFEVVELLRGLSEVQAGLRYAPDKWSIKEVIGHLLDTERVFAYRALSIARGETQSLPGFDQDAYVANGGFDGRTVTSLVGEYLHLRGSTIALFEGLEPEAWRRAGTANNVPVTVRALAFITAGHEAHHLAVLRERYLA